MKIKNRICECKNIGDFFTTFGKKTETMTEIKPIHLPEWAIEGQGVASVLSRYNMPQHLIAEEEFKHIAKSGGPDLTGLVDKLFNSKSTKAEIENKPNYLTLEEMNENFSSLNIKSLNILLADLGLQEKVNGKWELTAKGDKISAKGINGIKWDYDQIKSMLDWEEVSWT